LQAPVREASALPVRQQQKGYRYRQQHLGASRRLVASHHDSIVKCGRNGTV
jgi:hypothetical protein